MAEKFSTLPDPLITSDPNRLGGTPCFTGTRVPVQTLFDHLAAGDSIDVFLTDFPSVSRDHAIAVLNFSLARLLDRKPVRDAAE